MAKLPVYINDHLQVNLTVTADSMLSLLEVVKSKVPNTGNRFDIYLHLTTDTESVGSFNPDAFIPKLFSDHRMASITAIKLYTDPNWKADARPQ